ncbi:dihydroorotase [Myxococcota bacterium]|nr:dihydroorotase [Myxococcota bacterium]MBU1495445.1 dihydroorotase [Myxococcota bacterium]
MIIVNGHLYDPLENIDIVNGWIIVENGKIRDIGAGHRAFSCDYPIVDAQGSLVCPGFTDIHVHLRQPGGEHKATIESETNAALAGGYTHVLAMPNTSPPPDSVENLDLITPLLEKNALCRVSVCAAASIGRNGVKSVDYQELIQKGIKVFSDDGDCLEDETLLSAMLEKSAETGVTFSDHCEIRALSGKNPVNQGNVAVKLGLRGQKESSETVAAAKGIMLSYETGGHYHIQHISSSKTIELVRWAKARGLNVSCEVTPHHLIMSETDVLTHGTIAKCAPPLRTEHDRRQLISALEDGIIEYIATDHAPHDLKSKNTDMTSASFGIAAIETAVPLLLKLVHAGDISMKTLISCLTRGSYLLGCEKRLLPGSVGDFTIVDPDREWMFSGNRYSMGKNNPFSGTLFKGCIIYTIIDGIVRYEFTC